jgi:hypothetical protein
MDTPKPFADRDIVYDAVAAGRHSLRVGDANLSNGKATFPVAFEISVSRETYDLLTKAADYQGRSIRKVVRRLQQRRSAIGLHDRLQYRKTARCGHSRTSCRSVPFRACNQPIAPPGGSLRRERECRLLVA